jgi:hypothetical protein
MASGSRLSRAVILQPKKTRITAQSCSVAFVKLGGLPDQGVVML